MATRRRPARWPRAAGNPYDSDGFSGVSTTSTSRAAALRRLTERVLEAVGEDDLVRLLTDDLPEALDVAGATLLLWNRKLDAFETVTGDETRGEPARPEEPEAGFLLSDGALIPTGHGGDAVLVPLLARSGLAGMLVLGPPRSKRRRRLVRRRPLRRRDARLLSALAARAALVLENHLYLRELVATERVAALGTMASMLAHDFRTPMTVIRGYAELLRAEAATETARKAARIIMEMVDRLDRMTRETLDFARAGGRVARRSVPVAPFLAEIVDEVRRDLAGLEVDARVEVPPEAVADLDTDKLRRAILNLAANARDAMKGAGRLHLHARIASAAGGAPLLEVTLADEGPGIPESIRATLFEPFVTEGKKGGTGLGLAVARRFVEEHGGSLELLDPEEGGPRGARFAIRLPLAGAERPAVKMKG
jgi:signal transduction histidine kinase